MKYVFLNKDNVVANILEIEADQLDFYVKAFEEVTLFEGIIPNDVSYQHKLVNGELVYDHSIPNVLGEVQADPRDELIMQLRADMDYMLMFKE